MRKLSERPSLREYLFVHHKHTMHAEAYLETQ